ncbi:MAG TPA: hypothetical protein VMR31_10270 [Myxococcota bacterium]|nr:hypothetical protein [Myxococcota bacterium]
MPQRKAQTLRCDFCGADCQRVRRVALDQGYDRLSQRHVVRYACEACSRQKESRRANAVDSRPEPL